MKPSLEKRLEAIEGREHVRDMRGLCRQIAATHGFDEGELWEEAQYLAQRQCDLSDDREFYAGIAAELGISVRQLEDDLRQVVEGLAA